MKAASDYRAVMYVYVGIVGWIYRIKIDPFPSLFLFPYFFEQWSSLHLFFISRNAFSLIIISDCQSHDHKAQHIYQTASHMTTKPIRLPVTSGVAEDPKKWGGGGGGSKLRIDDYSHISDLKQCSH